ncbi:MAG: aldolase [Gemmatimonadetes bacterium]|nr:aldolase [Gemmatimonadota bacterium]
MRFSRMSALCGVLAALIMTSPLAAQEFRLNRTIETLESDAAVFGLFTANLSQQNARALATSDLDFLFIDMEHSPFDVETLRTFLLGMLNVRQVAERGNPQMAVTPLVRIPANGRNDFDHIVKQVLDVGAFGVVFPFIESAEQAERAVRAMRYPARQGSPIAEPRGGRGSSPGIASWFWGVGDYSARADVWPLNPRGELLAVLQIESREGVENIDAIAAVPGVGAIFVGPSDLSLSYGLPGSSPDVTNAIARVLAVCIERDIPCGITTGSGSVAQRLAEGFKFVTIGYWSDAGISTEPGNALGIGRRAAGRTGGN